MDAARLLCFALGASACGGEAEPPGPGSGGSSSTSLVVEAIGWTDPTEPTRILEPGSSIELWAAPQGGHVSRVGARIANLESDTVELRAELRDGLTVISSAVRTAPVAPSPEMPGVKETDRTSVSHFAHLALCPDPAGRAIHGKGYQLTLFVTELYADFSEGSVVLDVIPSCDPSDAFCLCECAEGYSPAACAPE
jgi:hypothetical protein